MVLLVVGLWLSALLFLCLGLKMVMLPSLILGRLRFGLVWSCCFWADHLLAEDLQLVLAGFLFSSWIATIGYYWLYAALVAVVGFVALLSMLFVLIW